MSPTETRLLLTFPHKVQTIQENANKKRTLEAASQRADALGGRGGQQTIQASFGKGDQEQLLDLAADFFYGCGLSFNVTNNPYFKAYIAGVSCTPRAQASIVLPAAGTPSGPGKGQACT